jgi:transcriptional regulator with XRE-family HTH domain
MAPKSNGHGSLWLTRSFNFVDKDPAIDELRTAFQDERKLFREADLAVIAGCSPSTVKNMFGGKTARPQHLTLCKLAGALGKRYALADDHKVDYAKELPQAKEEYKAHKEKLRKAREREERRAKR